MICLRCEEEEAEEGTALCADCLHVVREAERADDATPVLRLAPPLPPEESESLGILRMLDAVRARVLVGEIRFVGVVCIQKDNNTNTMYAGAPSTTKMEAIGAAEMLKLSLAGVIAGEVR